MTLFTTFVWIMVLLFDTGGQLSFKAAAMHGAEEDGLQRWLSMAQNKWIWLGLISYVVEIISWLAFLSMVPLSMAVLLGSLNIIVVMVGGKLFFNEAITRRRAVAIGIISLGVGMVGWG